jgi:hypothetical protein
MSKNTRGTRKRQRPGTAAPLKKWLPLIIVVALSVIGAAAIIIGNGAAAVDPEVTGAPAIEIEQTVFDLGELHFNQIAQVTYQIKNVGDQPLRILETPTVQVVEGC